MSSMNLGHALLTPVVAFLALLVAYGQYRTARHKSKIELFERRFSIYRRTIEFVRACWQDDEVPPDVASKFWSAASEAQFLFDKDVIAALEAIKKRRAKISFSRGMIRSTPPEHEIGLVYSMRDHQQWFSQAEGPITDVFRPYLQLQ